MADLTALTPEYEEQLLRTRELVIPRLLGLFDAYGIHATWATVGLLMFESTEAQNAGRPAIEPNYADPSLSSFEYLGSAQTDESTDPSRLGASIVRQILTHEGQEIGSHSFSHYYCLEDGQTAEAFEADLAAWSSAAATFEVEPRSLCFARNQHDGSAVQTCKKSGFLAYRGTEPAWFYQSISESHNTLLRKLLKRLDTYVGITSHHCPTIDEIAKSSPFDVASSRFFRSYHAQLKALEPLKMRRIRSGMTHAARNGGVYHLWWHPQDFAVDTELNFSAIESVFDRFAELREHDQMVSCNMAEVAERCVERQRVLREQRSIAR